MQRQHAVQFNVPNAGLSEFHTSAYAILGRDYSDIRWIRHNFFNVNGATCVLKTSDMSYTEAFAGSGEFAVVRLVVALVGAALGSLILFDEPEVLRAIRSTRFTAKA